MAQYINKSALVAEINKRIMEAPIDCYGHQRVWAYNDVKDILDTIEVKEVDLEKEVNAYMNNEMKFLSDEVGYDTLSAIARYFFELGIKATQKGE